MAQGRAERSGAAGAGRKARSLAWWLDSSIPLPGGFRIGLDGLIGLIPGVGDLLGGGLSTLIFYQACRRGLPKSVLARMAFNILIDTVLGAIPLLGDLFDFFWKANLRNLALMEQYQQDPRGTVRRSALVNLLIVVTVIVVAVLLVWLSIMLLRLLWAAITQTPQ